MQRRPFVQGTSLRKQVLRQRRIYTSFSSSWDALKIKAEQIREEGLKPAVGVKSRPV